MLTGLADHQTAWSGVLDEVAFLQWLYDVDGIPINDRRVGRDRRPLCLMSIAATGA